MRQLLKKYCFYVFASFAILFLVGYQIYRISQLDLHYLGEKLSFHIAPSYILFFVTIPLALLILVLLPGLFIISISFKFPIYNPKWNQLHLEHIKLLFKSFIRIFNRSKLYKVIRC